MCYKGNKQDANTETNETQDGHGQPLQRNGIQADVGSKSWGQPFEQPGECCR